MKCKYAAFEGVCTNGECPYRGDTCPTSEKPEVCKYSESEFGASELVQILRCCARDDYPCDECPANIGEIVCEDKSAMRQAADMLEKLAAEKNAKKTEWISVKDRLPEKNNIVLVCTDNGQYKVVLTSHLSSYGEWISYDKNRKVTHWMPFPEPPKEEER